MILITGATGTIGSEIVRLLGQRGAQVRAVTRNPGSAQLPAGTEIFHGDYADPASLAAMMAGIEAAFLIGVFGPEGADTDRALIAAAKDAGVRRVVKLSAIGTGDPDLGRVGTWHLPGENAVRDSGLEWTVLRPSSFASNTLTWADPIRSGQPVPNLTGTGRQGVIDPRDVAEVAVETLLAAEHTDRILTLTGPELLTAADQAATLAAILGHPIATAEIPEDIAREHMTAAGMSPEFVDGALAGQAFVRAGGNAIVTEDVHKVLTRQPRTYADWATAHAAVFRTPAAASARG